MENFNDLYVKSNKEVGTKLFDEKSIGGKKAIINKFIKDYMLEKISEFGFPDVLDSPHKDEVSVYDLIDVLGTLIPEEYHFDTLRHLTHYMLMAADNIQIFPINWWSSENDTLGNPTATFTENGIWDKIDTHPNESYITTFKFTYDLFQNKLANTAKAKKYILTENNIKPTINETN